jgi:hypothetical protein
MTVSSWRRGLPFVLLALVVSGCSHYGFSQSVKGDVSSIAVPILANETLEFGAEQDLTDAIIREFQNDNTLRVLGGDEAESILRGTVILYQRPVMSYDAAGNPIEYKVRTIARFSYVNLRKNEIIWEGDVEGWAAYSVGGVSSEFATEGEARAAAFVLLARDVLSKTVQGW